MDLNRLADRLKRATKRTKSKLSSAGAPNAAVDDVADTASAGTATPPNPTSDELDTTAAYGARDQAVFSEQQLLQAGIEPQASLLTHTGLAVPGEANPQPVSLPALFDDVAMQQATIPAQHELKTAAPDQAQPEASDTAAYVPLQDSPDVAGASGPEEQPELTPLLQDATAPPSDGGAPAEAAPPVELMPEPAAAAAAASFAAAAQPNEEETAAFVPLPPAAALPQLPSDELQTALQLPPPSEVQPAAAKDADTAAAPEAEEKPPQAAAAALATGSAIGGGVDITAQHTLEKAAYWQQARLAGATPEEHDIESFVKSLLESVKRPLLWSVGAYSDQVDFEKLAGIAKCKKLKIYTPDDFSNTHAFVCVLEPVPQTIHEPLRVAIVYRGTEPWELGDISIDLAYTAKDIEWLPGCKAHGGFLQTFDESKGGIAGQLQLLLREAGKGCVDGINVRTPDRIVCCGHSVGGAVATLAAAWCKTVQYPDSYIRCITLGCPRVGDGAFVKEFDRMMEAQDPDFGALKLERLRSDPAYRHSVQTALDNYRVSMRIMHALDVVPSLPPGDWRFAHVGNPVWLERRIENWGMDMVVWPGKDRPLHKTGWLVDHFEWRYRAARDIAQAKPLLAELGKDPAEEDTWRRKAIAFVLVIVEAQAQQVLRVVSRIPARLGTPALIWLVTTFLVLPILFTAATAAWGAFIFLFAFNFTTAPLLAVFRPLRPEGLPPLLAAGSGGASISSSSTAKQSTLLRKAAAFSLSNAEMLARQVLGQVLRAVSVIPVRYQTSALVWLATTYLVLPILSFSAMAASGAFLLLLVLDLSVLPFVVLVVRSEWAKRLLELLSQGVRVLTRLACELGL